MRIFLKNLKLFFLIALAIVFAQKAQAKFNFQNNLYFGLTSPEVVELQKVLNADPRTKVSESGVGSPGNETSYFGAKTKAAVMRFQEIYKNEILIPAGLSSGTGYVGFSTRAKLNLASGGNISNVSSDVKNFNTKNTLSVSSVSPSSFTDGDLIKISGEGFEAQNTIVLAFAPEEEIQASSSDGKNIEVAVTTKVGEGIRKTLSDIKSKSPSDIFPVVLNAMKENFSSQNLDGIFLKTYLVVKNSKGQSNSVAVTIKLFSN